LTLQLIIKLVTPSNGPRAGAARSSKFFDNQQANRETKDTAEVVQKTRTQAIIPEYFTCNSPELNTLRGAIGLKYPKIDLNSHASKTLPIKHLGSRFWEEKLGKPMILLDR